MKRLKNIESKNEQKLVSIKDQGGRQLEAIRDEGEKQLDAIGKYSINKSQKIFFYNKQDEKAKTLIDKINKIVQTNRGKSFVRTHSNGKQDDFNNYRDINQFGHDIYSGSLLIKDAEYNQYEMNVLIAILKNYNPINDKKVKSKKEVLKNSEILHIIRNKIIKAFKDGTFLLSKEVVHK